MGADCKRFLKHLANKIAGRMRNLAFLQDFKVNTHMCEGLLRTPFNNYYLNTSQANLLILDSEQWGELVN